MSVVEDFWKALISKLGCVVCVRHVETGKPASLHHVAEGSGARSTFAMVPICEPHHQGIRGLHGAGPKDFIRQYRPPGDSEYGLVVWMIEDLARYLRSLFRARGIRLEKRNG